MHDDGDEDDVNCGVKTSGNKFVLAYKVGKNVDKKNITWKWNAVEGNKYVASLEAVTKNGDTKYHNSAPIDGETYKQLGEPEKSMDDDFYKVKLKKLSSDMGDISEFFDVPQ
nr:hypothetical protein BaRGS_000592 [Batillaria attramentaria]